MVRKQNERTLLLQYRIITLSLPTKTLFLILASRPLSTRLGAFSSPRNIFPQIFSEIFSTQGQADFLLYFWREKLWGWRALAAPPLGGVSLFAYSLYSKQGYLFAPAVSRVQHLPESSGFVSCCSLSIPALWVFRLSCLHRGKFSDNRGKKGQKWIKFWGCLVFSRDFRIPKGAKS